MQDEKESPVFSGGVIGLEQVLDQKASKGLGACPEEASLPSFDEPDPPSPGSPDPSDRTTPGPSNHSHRHEAILQWLIANPERKLGECAKEFQLTQAWLSCIIHSDTFQEQLKKRQDECFSTAVISLRERISGVAAVAMDRLGEKVENTQDANFLLKAADMAMRHLEPRKGLGGPRGPGTGVNFQQNNYYAMADPGALSRARERMHRMREIEKGSEVILEEKTLPAPQEGES
jgi:hypothetical protein